MNTFSEKLYEGISIIVNKILKQQSFARIVNVQVVNQNNDGTYTITYSGKNYNVPLYGNNTIIINKTAKLFIPNNNMSLAFIM